MHRKDFYFLSSNGKTNIHAVEWTPDNTSHIKGIIQIAHGLNEHITMYESVAKFFTDRFFIVRGEDHLGHGESVGKDDTKLYFGPKDSWHFASDDIYKLRTLTKKEYGDIPYIMLGFSLGSYLIRDYLIRYEETIDAGIIVGCIHVRNIQHFFGTLFANVLAMIFGDKSKSKFLEFIMNGTSNKKIKNAKTHIDWLNENELELEKISHDPFAYGDVTIGLFRELMNAVSFTNDIKNIKKMNRNSPILFISGKNDPLAENGKTVEWLSGLFKEAGMKDVHTRLYKGRHRVLFEYDQENTLQDIYDWACSKLNTEGKNINELLDEYDKYLEKAIKNNSIKEKVSANNHRKFYIHSVKTDKAIAVTIEGSLNSITAPKLIDYCEGLKIDLEERNLVIDLQDIDYIAEPGKKAINELKGKYGKKLIVFGK